LSILKIKLIILFFTILFIGYVFAEEKKDSVQPIVITSHKATYYPEPEERVVFLGEPRATEGKNLVTGEKITYFMKDERAIVEKSRVYLKERKTGK
jgi:lipopolysaccharide export system protein LptA